VNSRALVLALTAVALAACVPPPAHLEVSSLTAGDVVAALAAPLHDIQTLAGSGTVRREEGDGALVADALLSLDIARGVRLDAVSPFFTPLLTLIVTKDEITLLDFRHQRAYLGPATARTAEKLLRLRVDPQLLVQVLAGGADLAQALWQPVPPQGEAEENLWVFGWDAWRVGIDRQTRRPVLLTLAGDDPLVISWESRRRIDDLEVARVIAVRRPKSREGLRLSLAEMKVNQPVDAALFQANIPADFQVQRLAGEEGR
jgi:hypothetical protein